MSIIRWSPLSSGLARPSEIDSLVDTFFNETMDRFTGMTHEWAPAVDVRDTGDAFVLHAEVPGLARDDIRVSYQDGVLTLEGEKKDEFRSDAQQEEHCLRVERRYGRFSRSFRLPAEVQADKVRAECKNGILVITVPKAEAVKPRMIDIHMN
jgi:HSP20 family protein